MSITERFARLVNELWGISPILTITLGILVIFGIGFVIIDFAEAFIEGLHAKTPITPEEEKGGLRKKNIRKKPKQRMI